MPATPYPVHYFVDRPARFTRLQLAIRFVAFCALGLIGVSFATAFLFAYLALPVFAATLMTAARPPTEVEVVRRGVLTALRWFAAVCAWAGLTAESLPKRSPDETVQLHVEGTTAPTAGSAMWRVLSGIPSALVLAVLCWIGALVWLWAALSILVSERVGQYAFDYLVGLQRWSARLLVYQASLVDEYPPFSFSDVPPPPAQA